MANQHIFNNTLIITGSVTASDGFYGDGSGLTGITAVAEWDGSRDGDASITGSFVVSGSSVNIDFTNTTGVSGSFSGSFSGDGSRLTNLNINGYQASGSELSGSFSGSFEGDGSSLTGLNIFPYNGDATITGSLTVSSSIIDLTDTIAISGSIFSGSFVGDGSGLTNLPLSEWDGSRDGDASVTGSFVVSGSNTIIQLLGDTTIDQNIQISNRNQVDDIAIGFEALPVSTINRKTIAIGYQSGNTQISGSDNILIGYRAGFNGVNTRNNIAIGTNALCNNTGLVIGSGNTLSDNIAIGCRALISLTTGFCNVAIGKDALRFSDTDNNNIAIGSEAGVSATGGSNVIIGIEAGRSVNRSNVIVGHQAGYFSTGRCNILIGYQSALNNLGSNNVAIGLLSGRYSTGVSSNNVYIGANAGPSTGTTESNQLYIGNTSGDTPLIRGNFSTGIVTINSCLKVAEASGSFIGDGSGLTGISGDGFPYNGAAVITGSLFVSQSTATGTAVTFEQGHVILTQVSESLNFMGGIGISSDQQAAAAGVPLGGLYRSKNMILIRIT